MNHFTNSIEWSDSRSYWLIHVPVCPNNDPKINKYQGKRQFYLRVGEWEEGFGKQPDQFHETE